MTTVSSQVGTALLLGRDVKRGTPATVVVKCVGCVLDGGRRREATHSLCWDFRLRSNRMLSRIGLL